MSRRILGSALLMALVVGVLLARCLLPVIGPETPPPAPVTVVVVPTGTGASPVTPVPAPVTPAPDIFTVPTSSPELVFVTPLPTATHTPTVEPTATVGPTETKVPATMVQRG